MCNTKKKNNDLKSIFTSSSASKFAGKHIIVPPKYTKIRDGSFKHHKDLESVTLSRFINQIGAFAFDRCSSLKNLIVDKNNGSFTDIDGVLFSKDKTVLILYPAGRKQTSYFIPDSVVKIAKGAFPFCDNLKNLIMPASVAIIHQDAIFGGGIENVCVNPNSNHFTDIDGVLFNKSKTLLLTHPAKNSRKSYFVPDTVTTIGSSAFNGSRLAELYLPDSVTEIGQMSFEDTLIDVYCDENSYAHGYFREDGGEGFGVVKRALCVKEKIFEVNNMARAWNKKSEKLKQTEICEATDGQCLNNESFDLDEDDIWGVEDEEGCLF